MRKAIPVVLLLMLWGGGRARAQYSYQPYVLGLRTAGMGGAATAFGKDSAMPWVNPSGLARTHVDTISLSANALLLEKLETSDLIYMTRELREALGVSRKDGCSDLTSTEASVIPSTFSYMFKLGPDDQHVLALSMIAPYYAELAADAKIKYDTATTEEKIVFLLQSKTSTYDVGPSYAVRLGPVTVGVSAFFRYLSYSFDRTVEGLSWARDPRAITTMHQRANIRASSLDLDLVGGAQLGPVLGGFYAGVAIHSPSLHLFGSGKGYLREHQVAASQDASGWYIIDTDIDIDDANLRTPLWFSLGLGYEMEETFAVAVDVNYFLGISTYNQITGTADVTGVPSDPTQDPQVQEDVDVTMPAEQRSVVNVSVGAEVYINPRIILRAGFFTDFGAYPGLEPITERGGLSIGEANVDRFGGTLGIAYQGDRSQFQLTLAYIAGSGDMIGMQAGVDNMGYLHYEYPNCEMYSSTFLVAFSGRIEAAALYAAFKSAYDEEIDRAENPPPDPMREEK